MSINPVWTQRVMVLAFLTGVVCVQGVCTLLSLVGLYHQLACGHASGGLGVGPWI
jgi:hypothetical protein